MDKFDWDLTARDQGNFDINMLAFLWFKDGVTPMVRKSVQLDPKHAIGRPADSSQQEYMLGPVSNSIEKSDHGTRPRQSSSVLCEIMRHI